MKKTIIIVALVAAFALVGWIEKGMACNPVTYYGCSAEYRIAAQDRQFKSRQFSQRLALGQLNKQKAERRYQKRLAQIRAAEAARKRNAKNSALARHESARNDKRRSSIMTQTSDGTWIQTDIQRGGRR